MMTTTSTICEDDLIQAITAFFSKNGYRVRHEVPNMGQSIDLAATKNRWITAVEAKLHDWTRGLKQCKAHELVADYICIAVATQNISDRLRDQALLNGYGIIRWDNRKSVCQWIERPKRNEKVWLAQRRQFSRNLRGIEYVE
ncbi:MAG TPA: hypothetical protein VMX36_10810 [Sedimentisphaerales bacterium]|nr:hypothetical protein [Sedimentisphaerales bacterium]